MEEHSQYLAEEVALDCADGLIDRREALRRLGLMGFTALSASTLLAACSSDDKKASTATTTPGAGPSTTAAGAGSTQAITYPGTSATLQGAWADAPGSASALIVIHENRGLVDHIRAVAARLARDGYPSLAPDLLSEEGGTAALGDSANATAALGKATEQRFSDDLKSSVDELERRKPGAKIGVIGFCFGGGLAWAMVANEPRLAAAAPFYGTVSPDVDFSRSKAAVFAVYAEMDDRVNATRPAAQAALERAALVHEIREFPSAGHAFFNDTGPRYNLEAAALAYTAVLDWFNAYLR